MKYSHIVIAALSVSAAVAFFACTKSNPVIQNPPVRTFSYAVGDKFVFEAWALDTLNNAKIPGSETFVHETIQDSGLTVGNVSGVYRAVDSTFDTTGVFIASDTIYIAITANTVSEYGLISSLMKNANAPVSIPPKWDKIVDNANTGTWVVDTTKISMNISGIPVPVAVQTDITGRDAGDSTLVVGGDPLLGDHAVDSGGVDVSTIVSSVGNLALQFNVYMSYQPTAPARIYAPSTKFVSSVYPFSVQGSERDLVSWSTK